MEHGCEQDAGRPQAQEEISGVGPRGTALSHRRCTADGYVVHSDLPESLPITAEEVALLRTFFSAEISAIIHGDNETG